MKQPSRQFPFAKFQPSKCKEVEMISYLLDCYDRVGMERHRASRVSVQFIML